MSCTVLEPPAASLDSDHAEAITPISGPEPVAIKLSDSAAVPLESLEAEPVAVFEAIEPVLTTGVSDVKRTAIICLLVTANFVQFISNFLTLSGGLTLSHALGRETGPGKANWMATSYSMTQSTFVLISGRLGAIYGHQRLALIGLFLFGVASVANGFCRTFSSFVAVRALSGVGGGIYMPNAVTALGLMVPAGHKRTLLYGVFAAAPPIGSIAGGLLAGLSAEWDGLWSWTVLFGALGVTSIACGVVLALIQPTERPIDAKGKIDIVGACLGLSGLLLFNIAWSQAPSVGWSSASSISILIVSVAIFAAFLVWEHRVASDPIMPLNIFRAPTFLAMIVVVLFSYMAFGIALWYSITWQQILRELSVLQIGLNFLPLGLGSTAAVGLAAYLLPRVEARLVMGIGVGVVLGSSLLLATMPMKQTYWAQVFPAMLLGGCCPDFVYLAAQVIASNSVKRKHLGIASSLVGTLNLYGISLGLGFAGTIEVEVGKNSLQPGSPETSESLMSGFKAALYFSAALAAVGLILDAVFVRVPRLDRHGVDEEVE